MSVTKVKPKHLLEYMNRFDDYESIKESSKRVQFEALAEMIVELNPEYEIKQFAKDYREVSDDQSKEEYSAKQFDAVIHDDLKPHISMEQREDWIDSTVQGLKRFA